MIFMLMIKYVFMTIKKLAYIDRGQHYRVGILKRVYPAIKKCTHKSFYFLMNWRSIKKNEEEKRVMATFSLCYRKLPNAEHSCAGHETSLMFSLRAFFLQVINVSTFR